MSITISAKQITVGVGNFPPFFIEGEQKGLFFEFTEAIFKKIPEYQVKYIFMSNSRLVHEINSGKLIDVACNIFPGSEVDAYLSIPIFRYIDVAISNKSKKLSINTEADLKGKSIAAYQGATELLGETFKNIALANPQYK